MKREIKEVAILFSTVIAYLILLVVLSTFQGLKEEVRDQAKEIYGLSARTSVLESEVKEEREEERGVRYVYISDTEIDHRETIRQAAREWGIDEYLAIAISRHETGNWKSKAFTEGFNYGGISLKNVPVYYESDYDGMLAYMQTLEAYRGQTVDEMAKRYCPGSDSWAEAIKSLIKEEKERVK